MLGAIIPEEKGGPHGTESKPKHGLILPGRQDDIFGDHHVKFEAGPDFERRGDVDASTRDFRAELPHLLAECTGDDLRTAVIVARSGLGL